MGGFGGHAGILRFAVAPAATRSDILTTLPRDRPDVLLRNGLRRRHDRCIIPLKSEHVDAWLRPDPTNLQAMYAILDDRERPYYEHREAA